VNKVWSGSSWSSINAYDQTKVPEPRLWVPLHSTGRAERPHGPSRWHVLFTILLPCILVLVVHNAANMGATDRFLLGPMASPRPQKSTRRRALTLEEPERLPGPLLQLC
jgi:hypothetical protein